MNYSKDSKQRLIAIGAVVIVALLGISAFQMFQNINNNELIEKQSAQIDETEKMRLELEKQYYESLSELEEMRGNNEELNAIIDQQKAELKTQKDKVARYIRQGKSSSSELAKAREEMDNLRTQISGYISENQKLRDDNQILVNQNAQLSQEKTNLEGQVAQTSKMNEELTTAKALLVNQKENLESQNASLSAKVGVASVIKVRSIAGTGFKIRKSGKAIRKKRAGAVDRMRVCFDATDNAVVESGVEKFYIRVTDPKGEVMVNESMGSGIMTSNVNNEEITYTKVEEINYNNQSAEVCMLWEPGTDFIKGEYLIEVYNKGFLAGKGTFTLK